MALAAIAVLSTFPVSAGAATWETIMRDCIANERLTGDYTRADLQNAKRNITGERVAYTECMSVISAAIGAASDAKAPRPIDRNGDGLISRSERRAAKRVQRREAARMASLNESPKPRGDAGIGDTAGDGGGPPILALFALGLLALGTGAWAARYDRD
jgi:hypothetical protein